MGLNSVFESENKKLELALKESEAKYRDLFENADDPMYTLDTAGNFQTINKAGLRILEAEKEDVIGSHISGWLTPESLNASQEVLRKQLSGEPIEQPVVVEVITKKGEHLWGEISTRVIRDGDTITGIHGIARDITEKKRLEQKLKDYHERLEDSEAKYRDLFDNANDPMYTLDTRGYFQRINNAGLEVLGGTKDEIIGSHISRWLTPDSLKAAQERVLRHISDMPVEESVVYELVCKDGVHKWAEIRTRSIKEGGRITGIHGIGRDITEKIRLERQLKKYHAKLERSYEELIEADRMKTEFVSNITHELLTPMTSIKGFTELLYDGTTGKINQEQKKSLEIIIRNSDRLIRLIKDLLDAANLDKHKFGLKFELVSMNDIISKTVQDMQPQAREKEITIVQKIAPLPGIWGDEERLTQVMVNLLTNALKFTPEKGTITVAAVESTNDIKINVTDTGIGIPADKLTRIFERFYQIDGGNSRKYGGAGLGLSICKSIIEQHYGSISARSDRNGSTFQIILPKLEHSAREV